MGLEAVELIMRVEEEFSIEILDSEAEQLSTPGALCDLIAYKLRYNSSATPSTCPTSRSFYEVRRQLMQLGVERHCITPSASLMGSWPRSKRRQNWRALSKALNYRLPPLKRSPEWAFIGLLPLGVFPILFSVSSGTTFLLAVLYVLSWCMGAHVTKPFAIHAPEEMQSVADLSRRLAPRFYTPDANYAFDLWQRVREIIADEMSLPSEQVTRDSDFVRDLGMG